jgi:hypothetical protein
VTRRKFTINDFHPMPARLVREREERVAMGERAMLFQQTFLDDCLRGILPHDLILIGAPTGMGKTDLALAIAMANADAGRKIVYFALEAEPRELERRTMYQLLAREVFLAARKHQIDVEDTHALNYADWYMGRCEKLCAPFYERVQVQMLHRFGSLRTFYREQKFDVIDLANAIEVIHPHVDLIVVDHLHYIDAVDEKANETRELHEATKTIRSIALDIGKPVILIAHLRKRDKKLRQLVADTDDFHGSSNVTKIATQVIAIEHALSITPSKPYLSPTFFSVVKDRKAGAQRLVAVAQYDRRTKSYERTYTLGHLIKSGTDWSEISGDDVPKWAKHHRPLEPVEHNAPEQQPQLAMPS